MRVLSFSHPVIVVHGPCIGNRMASQALDNTKSGGLIYRAFSSQRTKSSFQCQELQEGPLASRKLRDDSLWEVEEKESKGLSNSFLSILLPC